LCILTRVLFIGRKERSEKTKVIKLHYLVRVVGKGRDMNITKDSNGNGLVRIIGKGRKEIWTLLKLITYQNNLKQSYPILLCLLINASLQMGLELILWKTVSDITKDRKVLKKILKE
jgi:hypothetical protein